MKYALLSTLLALPYLASAQGLQEYIPEVAMFVYQVLIPFILGVGFLFVVVNIVRYFIVASTNPEGRETAKSYLLYSILAYVLILTFIGIVLMLANATNLGNTPPVPDYEEAFSLAD